MRRGRAVLRWVLPLAVLTAFALALRGRWSDVADELGRVGIAPLLLAGLLATCGVGLTFGAWRAVLADLGSPLPAIPGARTFFVGQLGKYVPGSVWPVVVQMRLGKRLGIPQTRMAAAFVVTLTMSMAWGLVVGLAAVPGLAGSAWTWVLLLVPVGLAALHPLVLNAALGWLLRVLRRPPLEQRLTGAGVARASAWLLAFWLVCGLHVVVLATALGGSASLAPVAVGGFALAFVAGTIAVVFPAGAGVRDPLLVAVLTPSLGVTSAVAVGLLSRLLLAVADGVLAGCAELADRLRR